MDAKSTSDFETDQTGILKKIEASSYSRQYTVLGAAFGSCFPIAAWIFDIWFTDAAWWFTSIAQIHQLNPIHFIIDLAPFVLGVVSFFLGQRHEEQRLKVRDGHRNLKFVSQEMWFQKFALDKHAIVSIADVKGNIIYVNDKFCEVSGYLENELIGQNHRLLLSGYHSSNFFHQMWRTIASGATWHGDIQNRKKDGRLYWVRSTIVPFMNDDGKPYQYLAIRTDITEQMEARVQAEAANQTKSDFLAAMSHEIRTPMAGVIGMAEMILTSDLSPQQLDWANSIKTSGESLMRILNEVLDQSKLEAGKLELSPTDFHLKSFVTETAFLFSPKMDEKGIKLVVDLEDELPNGLYADNLRIGQVLSNLLSNALKFTETGSITVHVMKEPSDEVGLWVKFLVTDSGIGINEDVQNNLFSAFTQADNSTSRIYGGTGLGLSISKKLTELMGGKIGVTSKKGKGSTFWFTVKCEPAREDVQAPDRRQSVNRWVASRPLNILVAEDNIINQEIIMGILQNIDHTVVLANDGEEAIECVQKEKFDIILMDIRMPRMNGLQASQQIRAMENENATIPIIALTADVSMENVGGYLEMGMNDVCSKPIVLPLLLKMINKLLDEEIHTPLARGTVKAKAVQDDGTKTSLKTGNGVENDRVFQIFSNIVEQHLAVTARKEKHPWMKKRREEDRNEITDLSVDYRNQVTQCCDIVRTCLQALEIDPLNVSAKNQMRKAIQTLHNQGEYSGYHLMTTIAESALNLIRKKEILGEVDIQRLAFFMDTIMLVMKKRLSGYGDQPGRFLMKELGKLSENDINTG